MKTYFTNYILVLLFAVSGCKPPTEPPIDNTPPGKRDYVWSIDSVDYGDRQGTIQLESIWGSSATDVWGANGDAPDVRDCLWHYDGIKWSRATEGTPITEFTGNKVVYTVWGSDKNNVWAFGRKINQNVLSAFIMHYDGSHWIDATPANISDLSTNLYNVYASDKNNIWVGGYEYALHYDGSKWNSYKVADSMTVISITSNNTNLFFETGSPWGKDTSIIYKKIDNSFKFIDGTKVSDQKFGALISIIGRNIISFTNGVISTQLTSSGDFNTSGWHRVLTTPTFFSEKFVQSLKNVFAVGQWNLVYQYNGTDWAQININVPNHSVDPFALFWGVWTDGNEVFICDTQNGIIYHGR